MADVQVTCITKPNPDSPHEHITHLGNPAGKWKWTREQVINSIDAKTNTFFVLDSKTGKRSNVRVYALRAGQLMFGPTPMGIGTTIYYRLTNARFIEHSQEVKV